MYEEPVIGKVITQAEEMVIYKTLSERTATVRETVRQTQVNIDGQAKIQVRPPLESAGEISLKVEEPPKAPIQSQVETARDTGVKVEEQKKAQVHPQAEVGVAAGFRPAPGEKSHELANVPNPVERKDQTNPGGNTKTPQRP